MIRLRSLFWKIFFIFWLANLLVLLATTVSIVQLAESEQLLENHQRRIAGIAEQIIIYHERGMRLGEGTLSKRPREFPRRNRHLRIYDPEGRLVFGRPPPPADQSGQWLSQDFTSDSGLAYRIVSRRPPVPRFVEAWIKYLLSLRLVIILVVSGLVSGLLTWMITKPLRKLGLHLTALAAGNTGTRVENRLLARGDEIGDLASQLNIMAERIDGLINSKQALLQDVSHELRAPLARLQAAAALASRKRDNRAEIDRIEKECARLDTLIGEILSLARADSETAMQESIDIREVIADAMTDAEYRYPSQSIELDNFATPCPVLGNVELLNRLFGNILDNACKHNLLPKPVEIRCRESAFHYIVEIRDHGPGVSESELPQLTKAFFRGKAEESFSSGFGLGLSIAARAAAKHGGGLELKNHPEGGLVAKVTLPVR